MNQSIETNKNISKMFENTNIRTIWDSEKNDYYFSVVDVIEALTNSPRPRKYWNALKTKLASEGSELSSKLGQLKLKSLDGKYYKTDVLDTKGILRLIQSIPSSKAEPFKLWLAELGSNRIDDVFDPSQAIDRAINYYRQKGYNDDWIERRIKAIIHRKQLTDTWKECGIKEEMEYAILTNEIYKTWSGMKAHEYKDFKGIRKESLRDNMSELEVLLTDIGELATKELVKEYKPHGIKENRIIAKKGGTIAKNTRNDLEHELKRNILTPENNLGGRYLNENQINNNY